jgi:hypothetical protein
MDLGEDLGGGKAFYSMPLSPFIIIIIFEVCVFFCNFHFFVIFIYLFIYFIYLFFSLFYFS